MFKGRAVEIREEDTGVALARAAIEVARIQAIMASELAAGQAAAEAALYAPEPGAAAAQPRVAVVQAVDLSEAEQQERDAEYFNAEAGMQMQE